MENASKALLMAGEVLIGVLMLSLIIYLYSSFGAKSEKITQIINQNKLTRYNAQYTIFDGRKDLSVYDVVTIMNTAYKNYEKHKDDSNYDSEYAVTVKIGPEIISFDNNKKFNDKKIDLINENLNKIDSNKKMILYACEIEKYHDNGKVYSIKITGRQVEIDDI